MNSYKTNLKDYFPMIRTRKEVLAIIAANPTLSQKFHSWRSDQQERFLDMCTGVKGVKILYDTYFKEIFNPETTPERLSELLSILLKRKVTVKYQLTNDNTRLGDEHSLVITDIVVELEDGSIANIEVQKIGYAFTGERASCYSADLLLRQYKRARDIRKEKFTYKDVYPVYTIVFMERSPESFHKFKDTYIHTFKNVSDSEINLNLLQNFIFIPIDIFLEKLHNEGVNTDFDAWMTFLGCDEPEYIIKLISKYPKFIPIYENLYNICRNIEGVMNMFSEELTILDRNTVTYMIDELQAEVANKDAVIADKDAQLANKDAQLANKDAQLANKDAQLTEARRQIVELTKKLQESQN